MKNILFMHGGGPTAVINASLSGSIRELYDRSFDGDILYAPFGTGGLLKNKINKFPALSNEDLIKLERTPGSAIGTGRDHLEGDDYDKLASILKENNIGYVVMTGGNGTMDTCRKLSYAAKKHNIVVTGTPKTMDNDLSVTDNSPGFGSAARYIAACVREASEDVLGLPIHACVIEALGRDAGWVTASAIMAKSGKAPGADIILVPEVAFDKDKFLTKVEKIHKEKGGVVIVASEGMRYSDGKPIVEPVFQVGRSVYFGDVSSHLSNLIIKELGIKSRSEKPGILGRASISWQSDVDRAEAIACGRVSVKCALEGKNGYMSVIKRTSSSPYKFEAVESPILDSILEARTLDEKYIDKENMFINESFIEYAKPLIGSIGDDFCSFV